MRSKEERERQILDAMRGCSLDQAAKISKAIDDEAAQSVAEFKERLRNLVCDKIKEIHNREEDHKKKFSGKDDERFLYHLLTQTTVKVNTLTTILTLIDETK